jgi:DNA-directed RNA polymerase subunit K/omega
MNAMLGNVKIRTSDLAYVGADLDRPESVLVTARDVYCTDRLCGVVRLGSPKHLLADPPREFLPNGFAMLPNGDFLIANLGADGGVWRLDHSANLDPWLLDVDGEALRVANFVCIDHAARIWVTVSTRRVPRERSFGADLGDGFIVCIDKQGPRIVADGMGFTNECRVDQDGRWLYVNETYSRCLSRFPIVGKRLGAKEIMFEFSDGDFPDGLEMDAEGGVWVACLVSNRVLRIAQGRAQVIVDDSDPDIVSAAERSYASGCIQRTELDAGGTRTLRNVSSIAFGGPDLRTVYLGSLFGTSLATFKSPIPGVRPVHWNTQ